MAQLAVVPLAESAMFRAPLTSFAAAAFSNNLQPFLAGKSRQSAANSEDGRENRPSVASPHEPQSSRGS
jgi:hypothetical protein